MDPIITLVIEDDDRIGAILSELVAATPGFSLLGRAGTLAQADEMMAGVVPQLLLVDISLPDGSGLEWVNRLRSHNREAYVIMVTASREVETIQQALNLGVHDYIIKPLRLFRIQQSLDEILQLHRKLCERGRLEQEDLDKLLGKGRPQAREMRITPKGIDSITLRQVLELLAGEPDSVFSTDTVALRLSLSRTTARRYLEYLESEDRVDVELNYGQRGRPERRYRWRRES
ncbi:response regulator [Aeromonas enteropelogenes]|uniref:Transcriptional regulatory protein n=1 Tax=Aeromonas sp. 19NY04SH05-1 TaxID=2920537 RepID=A0AAU6T603_9GAMM|nr:MULTISPECIES: response regulator [Aeromonas]QXC35980.1 response regulator [Aeromonas sp. FDAARGOS 1407]UBH52494.1 response regulator [Aeromonas enteropelogenes]BEE18653.1 transcriptional regulatory protein [Aeromonas enteropelogenes]BEE22815.1 transcriptional regulatory protein [Aeromonas enteropelogenes]